MEERTDKGMDQKEKRKRNVKTGGRIECDIATYNEMFRMNYETFEEILTAIGLWLPKQLTEKLSWTIIRVVIDYHEKFEQAQSE